MSILNAMYSGVSGLSAESDALGIVGDNVSNSNTVGFKRSRAEFENQLGGAVGSSVGAGVRLARSQQIFAQGTLQTTGQPTDLALSGDGFFVVKGNLGGAEGQFYTRNGQLTVQNDGTIANTAGMKVQGYQANPDGTFSSSLGDVTLPSAGLPPRATAKMTMTANLDSTATTPTGAWDPQNPGATSNISTSMTSFDSLGRAHTVDVYFRKTSAGQWEYHALAKGAEVTGGTAGQNSEIASGTMQFTTNGAMQSVTPTTGGTVNFVGATPNQPLALDFGKTIAAGGTGLEGTTQFGSASAITGQSQDGYASGDLSGVKVDSTGVVSGVYSNGQTVAAGKLAIAKFRDNEGLGKAGQNMWVATKESGEAALGTVGTGGRASVVSGALEQSNVDVAEQFVDLITHQRSFQANSKVITTADQMLQELMQIKQ
ncbi:MAG: Flagellar hook protein FlgE [Labilithrix sp.]|nr:Flagellar hook protein FlgE [Labilithrix sp.]